MSDAILDASALLAWLNGEPMTSRVAEALADGAAISSVNLSEVIAKLADAGGIEQDIREVLAPLGLEVRSFDADDAYLAGVLRPETRALGLSLGDRACLATAIHTETTALTTDQSWADLELSRDVRVVVVR